MVKACSRTVATLTRTTIANKSRKIVNRQDLESSDDDDDAEEDCVAKKTQTFFGREDRDQDHFVLTMT